jgi:hypothetical protein
MRVVRPCGCVLSPRCEVAKHPPAFLVSSLRGVHVVVCRVIIERFGRFPHRNALLSRESTPEEAEFLTTHTGF